MQITLEYQLSFKEFREGTSVAERFRKRPPRAARFLRALAFVLFIWACGTIWLLLTNRAPEVEPPSLFNAQGRRTLLLLVGGVLGNVALWWFVLGYVIPRSRQRTRWRALPWRQRTRPTALKQVLGFLVVFGLLAVMWFLPHWHADLRGNSPGGDPIADFVVIIDRIGAATLACLLLVAIVWRALRPNSAVWRPRPGSVRTLVAKVEEMGIVSGPAESPLLTFWSGYDGFAEGALTFTLLRHDGEAQILPKRAFPDAASVAQFRELLRRSLLSRPALSRR